MKFARVISLLAKKLGVSEERALDVFYSSKTYEYLNDYRNGLHNMSDGYLVNEVLSEFR